MVVVVVVVGACVSHPCDASHQPNSAFTSLDTRTMELIAVMGDVANGLAYEAHCPCFVLICGAVT